MCSEELSGRVQHVRSRIKHVNNHVHQIHLHMHSSTLGVHESGAPRFGKLKKRNHLRKEKGIVNLKERLI